MEECKYFLHSRDGNSFHFRQIKTPHTDMEGFTLTYIKHGYTVLTGDMGCLSWQRYHDEYDYGFPGNNTGIGYFSEKVHRGEWSQEVFTWDYEKAIEEIKAYFEPEIEEEEEIEDIEEQNNKQQQLNDMLDCEDWGDCGPVVGEYKMLQDLDEYMGEFGSDWYESKFGQVWEQHFKRKYEMVKSVSHLVLNAVYPELTLVDDGFKVN